MILRKIQLPIIDLQSLLFGFLMFSSTMSYVSILGIKIWYISLVLCSLYFLFIRRISMPRSIVYIFIGLAILASTINIIEFGFRRDFFNYILGIGLICYSYTFVKRLGIEKTDFILIKVAILNVCGVLFNTITQLSAIKEYLLYSYIDHPVINTLCTGGPNIDASWVSIYCVAFYKSKYKWIYMMLSLGINTLYAARVGFLINFFVLFIFLYQDRKLIYKTILLILGIIATCIPYIVQSSAFSKAIARFSEVGGANDEGGVHRLIMWKSVPDVILNYPYGVGPANTVAALDKVTGVVHRDGNLHNLLFEYFCSVGVLGGIIYVILFFGFLKYLIKYRKNLDTVLLMMACYLIGGMVQFSGDESIMFLLVGCCLGSIYIRKSVCSYTSNHT